MLRSDELRALLDGPPVDDEVGQSYTSTLLRPQEAPLVSVLAPRQAGTPIKLHRADAVSLGEGDDRHVAIVGSASDDDLRDIAVEHNAVAMVVRAGNAGPQALRTAYRRARLCALAAARVSAAGLVDPVAALYWAAIMGDDDCRSCFVRTVMSPLRTRPHKRASDLLSTAVALHEHGWHTVSVARARRLTKAAIIRHIELMAQFGVLDPRAGGAERDKFSLAVALYRLGYGSADLT